MMERSGAIIDVDAEINARKVGNVQLLVGLLGACALAVEGFDTSAIGYIQPQITRAWSIPPETVGWILSADMFGLLVGYLLLAPLSARFGHKRMVIASTTFFGLMTFFTITAGNVSMLIFFRVLTGLGVGGAMPSAVALTGEYMPERVRSTSVTLIYIGYSIGQIAAGAVSGLLLQSYSWRAVLGFGGGVTLIFALIFVFALPESIEYLINRGQGAKRAIAIFKRVAPDILVSDSARLIAGSQGARRVAVRQLLEDGRALGTILVWIGMFMNLSIYFLLQKWFTSLLVQVGLSQSDAIFATTVSLAGGIIAAFILGPLMDRFGPYLVVSGLFAVGALACAVMGSVLSSPTPTILIAMSLAIGFCLSGGQKANNALSVYFYPTALRGTGLGWSLGIGRFGGWLSPIAAGMLLAAGWTPSGLFYLSAAPMMIGAIAILLMGQHYGQTSARRRLAQSGKA
jgi:MFS transporter, AAHS family, 4-hydroxybenzoate transporter